MANAGYANELTMAQHAFPSSAAQTVKMSLKQHRWQRKDKENEGKSPR